MNAPATTLNELAAAAIEAFALFNAENARLSKAWHDSVKAGGYAAHFKQRPEIAEHLQMELLENIVFYDDDAKATLDELRWQNQTDDKPTLGRVRLSDAEWDFATSRGVA